VDGPRAVVAGGSGFIGTALVESLRASGYEVQILSRIPTGVYHAGKPLYWDGETVGEWKDALESADLVVNFSGETVSQQWTDDAKKAIRDSRVKSTRAIGEAIAQCTDPPKAWLNASAVGIYGNRGSEVLTEDSEPGTGFLAEVCVEWEQAVADADTPLTKKRIIRIGPVLGEGGLLDPLITLTRWFLGGRAGSGDQYLSWIHLDDLISMMRWLADQEAIQVALGTAPNPVTNEQFMFELRRALHRPWSPPVPAFAIRAFGHLFGPDPSLILEGCRAVPKAALDSGFAFRFTSVNEAFEDLV
jgi:uncharacterized protein